MNAPQGEPLIIQLTEEVSLVGDPAGTLGRSNAVVIVDGRSATIVDTFLVPELAGTLQTLIRSRGAVADVVVNTHPHIDHVGGNSAFPEARVVAHRATTEMVAEMALDTSFLGRLFPHFETELARLEVRAPEPIENADLPAHIQVLSLGMAHSPGDIALWLADERVAIVGDICFNQVVPLALPRHASIGGWITALDTLIALDPVIVIPGHGPPATVDTLVVVRDYLRDLLEVASLVAAGEVVGDDWARLSTGGRIDGWAEPNRHALNLQTAVRQVAAEISAHG